jgi:hypothetical protein
MVAHHPIQILIRICGKVVDAGTVGVNSEPHLMDNIIAFDEIYPINK